MPSIVQFPEIHIDLVGCSLDAGGETINIRDGEIHVSEKLLSEFLINLCMGGNRKKQFLDALDAEDAYVPIAEHCCNEYEDSDGGSTTVWSSVCIIAHHFLTRADPTFQRSRLGLPTDIAYHMLYDKIWKKNVKDFCAFDREATARYAEELRNHMENIIKMDRICDKFVELFRESDSIKQLRERIITDEGGLVSHVEKTLQARIKSQHECMINEALNPVMERINLDSSCSKWYNAK